MVWPLGLQRLYYVGQGASQAMDPTSVADAGENKYPTEKLKNIRNEIQMRPGAKGVGSLFPKKTAVSGAAARYSFRYVSTG